jgi:transcriptional regulator with XRE-family HTH domain
MPARHIDEIRKRRPLDAGARERVDALKRAMQLQVALAELRELRGVSQAAVAKDLGTSRPNVSRIENETDVRLSTLERYVEALGGRLEIHAPPGKPAAAAEQVDAGIRQPAFLPGVGVLGDHEVMKSRHASAAATSTCALAPTSRAACTASPGRSSVLDGMHAQ